MTADGAAAPAAAAAAVPPPASAASSNEAVALRVALAETNARLRAALAQVHALHASHTELRALAAAGGAPPPERLQLAWDGLRRGFVMGYMGRAGLGVVARALALLRSGRLSALGSWQWLSETSGVVYRCVLLPIARC